jgi:predicted nucleic acid-binding protein
VVLEEPESDETRFFIRGAQWVSSELMMTELPRAIRHKAAIDRDVDLERNLRKSEVVLDKVDLFRVERIALWRAGKIFEPHLRSLDAIHVITALEHPPIDAFVTHDLRQVAAARDAGLPTVSPGM